MAKLDTKSITTSKAIYINQMFTKIANRYDLLNDLMTFCSHKRWKKEVIQRSLNEIANPRDALDLCAGTCDLGIILSSLCPETKITCIDNCKEMLDIGLTKIKNLNNGNINVLLLDSENLPFNPESFDLITIGFGLRNLVNKEKCIKDIYKLLRKSGVFACIDLGHPQNSLWKKIFFFYFFKLVPRLGEMFASNKEAYTYLGESLHSYYKQTELKELILNEGFKKCYFKNILGGVVSIHIATK